MFSYASDLKEIPFIFLMEIFNLLNWSVIFILIYGSNKEISY